MKHRLCAIVAFVLTGALHSSAALAEGRAPASPWSKLFPLPADRPEITKPPIDFRVQAPAVVHSEAMMPCSRITAKRVDPTFDREMRHAAPAQPVPATRSLPTRTCPTLD